MISERLRRQDGAVRDVIKYLALAVVIVVIVLDAVAVVQTQLSIRQKATDAAKAARSEYVETGSEKAATAAARSYLETRDATFIAATIDASGDVDKTVVVVTAEDGAETFVYKYLTRLPWAGERVENLLEPTVVGETGKSNI
jgi:hypothetical protein